MKRVRISVVLAAALVAVASGCGDDAAVNPQFNDPDPTEPTAGTWNTYVLADGSSLRPPAPPVAGSATFTADVTEQVQLSAARDAGAQANIDYWDGGTARRWNEYQRYLIKKRSMNPPRASRGLALVSVAMYDAMVAAWDAKYTYSLAHPAQIDSRITVYGAVDKSPSYVPARTTMSRAASDVLRYLFPSDADSIALMYASAVEADMDCGNYFGFSVDAGAALGAAVASAVIARGTSDNSSATFTGTPPSGPQYWIPTPPAFVANPLEPACGQWRPWVLATGQAVRPAAPPSFSGPEFNAQKTEVYETVESLTDERRAIAFFWADGAGTVTPPGHWNQIAVDMAVSKGFTEPRMARMLALLGMAQADAFISCWDCKYAYWCLRPVTAIRMDLDGDWLPPITTPPFPSYPSGHSTTSGAAATVLGYIFPEDAVGLRQMGTEAMNSRLYGGIHFAFDNTTGFNMGGTIGARVIALAARDGSPAVASPRLGASAASRIFGRERVVPDGARFDEQAD